MGLPVVITAGQGFDEGASVLFSDVGQPFRVRSAEAVRGPRSRTRASATSLGPTTREPVSYPRAIYALDFSVKRKKSYKSGVLNLDNVSTFRDRGATEMTLGLFQQNWLERYTETAER